MDKIRIHLWDYTELTKAKYYVTGESEEKNFAYIKTKLSNSEAKLSRMIKIEDFNDSSEFLMALLDKVAESKGNRLFKLADEEEGSQFRLHNWFGGKEMMQQYVGILEFQEVDVKYEIYIGSRFDRKSTYFINYVLSGALDVEATLFPDMNPSVSKSSDLEQLLAIIFINQIDSAFRKGIYRKYRSYENNDSRVRGKIDVARHIKMNPLFNGKVSYSYREYTADNEVNRLILTAYKMLEKKYSWVKSLAKKKRNVKDFIGQLENVMEPVSKQEVSSLLSKGNKKITNPIYRNWDEVRKTAVELLRHMGVHIGSDGNWESCGVLIDMTKIWEKYLENIFTENSTFYKQYEVRPQEEEDILIPEGSEEGMRTGKPDFVWMQNASKYAFVLDAKYKIHWSEISSGAEKSWTYVREDVFQVMSYMYSLPAHIGGIVCPNEKLKSIGVKGPYYISKNCRDHFYVFSLPVVHQGIEAYDEYKDVMKEVERDLAERIGDVLSKINQ